MDQLTRIRRHRTGTHQIETERCIGDDDFVEFAIADKVVGDTITVLHSEFGVEVRLTDIAVHKDGLLAGHRIERRQVGAKEGLTVTGLR